MGGFSLVQMSMHLEQRVWKGQPLGGFMALGTSPSSTDSVECSWPSFSRGTAASRESV